MTVIILIVCLSVTYQRDWCVMCMMCKFNSRLASASKGVITSKIKHAIKLKTSPARLAQLLQPLLAFCFSLQLGVPSSPGRYAVIGCKLKQNANEGCNSCESLAGLVLSFIACLILHVIAP